METWWHVEKHGSCCCLFLVLIDSTSLAWKSIETVKTGRSTSRLAKNTWMVSSGTLQWVERPQPLEIPNKFAKALSTSPTTSPQQSQSYQSASVCVLLSPSSSQFQFPGHQIWESSTPTWNNQYQPGHPRPKRDCWNHPNLLGIKSLDPKGENGRKVDQIGQASRLIGSNALLFRPKKTSQKWSYSQIHDPLQGSKHF